MSSKRIYNQIQYFYEERFASINKNIYIRIIQELCNYNPNWIAIANSFYGEPEELFNTLHLYSLREKQDISFLYKLLETYHYNFFHTVLLCISDICNVTYEKTEEFLIQQYLQSPFLYDIQKIENYYTIDSILGKISFWKAPSYFESLDKFELAKMASKKELSDYCHAATYEVCKALPESFACTALCKQAFVGEYYHSFTFYQNHCIDLNYNCVIPMNIYLTLIHAEIIQKIAHEELEKKLQEYRTYDKLLYSAIDAQIRKRNLKIPI